MLCVLCLHWFWCFFFIDMEHLNICQGICALFVLVALVCYRGRKESFILLTVLCMIMACIAGTIATSMAIKSTLWNVEINEDSTIIGIIYSINIFFLMMSHQFFGVQYLRTSLVLPKLFD